MNNVKSGHRILAKEGPGKLALFSSANDAGQRACRDTLTSNEILSRQLSGISPGSFWLNLDPSGRPRRLSICSRSSRKCNAIQSRWKIPNSHSKSIATIPILISRDICRPWETVNLFTAFFRPFSVEYAVIVLTARSLEKREKFSLSSGQGPLSQALDCVTV